MNDPRHRSTHSPHVGGPKDVSADADARASRLERIENQLKDLLVAAHAGTSGDHYGNRDRLHNARETFAAAGVLYLDQVRADLVSDTGTVGVERFTELNLELR